MKKLLTLLCLCVLCIGSAWGEEKTYTMTIDSSDNGGNNVHWTASSTSSLTFDNITWSTSVTGTTSFTANTTYCQIGSKSNPATKVTISTNGFAGKTIKSIAVTCYCMSNTGPTLTVTAGSTTMINPASLTKTTSTEIKSAEGTSATLGSDDNVTITFNSSAKAAICISKVEVTYEEGASSKQDQEVSFKEPTTTVNIGANVYNTATTTGNGAITYSSSNNDIATVSADGTVTGVAEGTATITATAAATDNYNLGTASYDITVVDPTPHASIDFSGKYEKETAVENFEIVDENSTKLFDGIFDKGTNSNAPKYYTSGDAVRVYAGNTLTISSTASKKTIVKIVFTYGSSDGTNAITADCGEFSNNTWIGANDEITFTVGGSTGNRRIQKISVYYSDEEFVPITLPVFNPDAGYYTEAQTITITQADGYDIYYTTDGSNPRTNGTPYTEPFEFSEVKTTEIKAAAKNGNNWSKIASALYTILKESYSPEELFDVVPTQEGVDVNVVFNNNEITAIASNTITISVADDKTFTVYSADIPVSWEVGGKVSGTVAGTWKLYGKTDEFAPNEIYDFGYEAPAKNTITWMVKGIIFATSTINVGSELTLPTVNPTVEGYTFEGWCSSQITEASETKPAYVDANTVPSGDATYYAVFSKSEGGSESSDFSLDVTSGDFTISYDGNYASTAIGANDKNGKISTTTDKSMARSYTFTRIKDGVYTIYDKDKESYIKYNSSTDLAYASNAYEWTITQSAKESGCWRISSQTSGRALIYRTTMIFGGYSTSNVTSDGEYHDVVIGGVTSSTTATTYTTNPDGNLKYEVSISQYGWATACVPFNATVSGEGVTAYYVKANGTSLTKTEAAVVPANEGVLLKLEGGGTATFTETTSDADANIANDLVGSLVAGNVLIQEENSKHYILGLGSDNKLGFYWDSKCKKDESTANGAAAFCGQYKAILVVPSSSSSEVKSYALEFDDVDVDAINSINADKKQNDGAIYNLNGQRLNGLQKGLNIVNGKKLFVK